MTHDQETAITAFFDAVGKLEQVKVIRSSRFLGDISEFLCAEMFGTSLVSDLRQPGHDGIQEDRRVQVKFNNSPTGNNINVGNPDKYEELIVVIGPRSKLREIEHGKDEFRFYCFTSDDVRPWRTGKGSFYCAKERISKCHSKHILKTSLGSPAV
jgi:hypothetical protein